MAPPGCLPRCRPRGSVHRRGRARHLPPPPRPPSRGPGFPSVARRCAREDRRGSARPADAGRRPGRRAPRRPRRPEAAAGAGGDDDDDDDGAGKAPAAAPPPPPPPPPRLPAGGSRTRPRAHALRHGPERPEGSALGLFPLPRQGPPRPESGTLPLGQSPAPRCGKGRRSRLLPAPKAPPDSHHPSPGARQGGGRASGRGPCRAPPPSRTRAAPAQPEERAGLGRTRAVRAWAARAAAAAVGDRRSAAPAATARARGRTPPPPSGGGRTGGRPALVWRGGKGGKRRRDGGERAALRGPAATRGVARGEPRPRARWRARAAALRRAGRLFRPPPSGRCRAPSSLSLGLRRAAARRPG
ncbi:translation initiation factor IF-2-like [Vidua chalybeata]|uniref:translation initiation factor IF-2-like n=1 Tax=Vidua chalybeata TaxID=81927 RepID=UPI0023A90177|nr:translation initiation factor IF-2-like [Vidua chalybeata]